MRGAIILPYIPLISLPPASFTICPNLSDPYGRNAIPSGERAVWPEERHFDTVSSGERTVWPDGNALGGFRSQKTRISFASGVAHILTLIKNGMTIRAERAASLAKCLVKNSVNIIYR